MIPPWHKRFRVSLRALGSELITVAADRDFSAGQSNWTVEAGNDVTWDNTDMDFACDESNIARLAVTLTEGNLYKLQFDISAYTSGGLLAYVGGTSQAIIEAVDTFIVYIVADAANYIQFSSSDFIGSIDNVSLKKVL